MLILFNKIQINQSETTGVSIKLNLKLKMNDNFQNNDFYCNSHVQYFHSTSDGSAEVECAKYAQSGTDNCT